MFIYSLFSHIHIQLSNLGCGHIVFTWLLGSPSWAGPFSGNATGRGWAEEFSRCSSGHKKWNKNNDWLVVWNIFFIFPYIGNNHPNWLSYFSEGLKPPTRWKNHEKTDYSNAVIVGCGWQLCFQNQPEMIVINLRRKGRPKRFSKASIWTLDQFVLNQGVSNTSAKHPTMCS